MDIHQDYEREGGDVSGGDTAFAGVVAVVVGKTIGLINDDARTGGDAPFTR